MSTDFRRGFLTFDKNWIHENQFIQSLSHAEFRIMVYLLCSVLRVSKQNQRFKNGELIATLYQKNGILFVNASQETIAEKCNLNRSTAYRAVHKFRDKGAIIKVVDGGEEGCTDLHIVGFEYEKGQKDGKLDYFLVDSLALRSGKELPENFRMWLTDNYTLPVFHRNARVWQEIFGVGARDLLHNAARAAA